jgi:hypothetical protein
LKRIIRNRTTIFCTGLILTIIIAGCKQNGAKNNFTNVIITKDTLLETVYLKADSTGTVKWQLKENAPDSVLVQQFRWNRWITFSNRINKENISGNTFMCRIPLHTGNNQIRLKSRSKDGAVQYSKETEASSYKPNIRLFDKVPYIEFTDSTMYELYNEQGKLIISGTGNIIHIDTMPTGMYYLNYDNVMTQFVNKH